MTFDERILLVVKWLVVVIVFFGIIMPAQILWFIIYPLFGIAYNKFKKKDGAHTQLNLDWFTPVEWYSNIIKRLMILD